MTDTTACVPMRNAFTLIELLVVISIVAILAAMLMPVIGTVRDAARSAACSSNLRQVGMAMSAYAIDWEGLVVPCYRGYAPAWAPIGPTTATYNWRGALELWGGIDTGALHGWGGNARVFGCAVQLQGKKPMSLTSRYATYSSNGRLSASVNGSGSPSPSCPQEGTPLNRIGFLSEVVFAADGLPNGLPTSQYNVGIAPIATNLPESPHRGRTNMVYLDGHAASQTAQWIANTLTTYPTPGSVGYVFWKGSLL